MEQCSRGLQNSGPDERAGRGQFCRDGREGIRLQGHQERFKDDDEADTVGTDSAFKMLGRGEKSERAVTRG